MNQSERGVWPLRPRLISRRAVLVGLAEIIIGKKMPKDEHHSLFVAAATTYGASGVGIPNPELLGAASAFGTELVEKNILNKNRSHEDAPIKLHPVQPQVEPTKRPTPQNTPVRKVIT